MQKNTPPPDPTRALFSDEDLALAMRDMESFVDITPEDLREILARAAQHARERAVPAPAAAPAAAAPAAGYLAKLRGGGHPPPAESPREIAVAWLVALACIGTLAWLSAGFFEPRDALVLTASFGATTVLVSAAYRNPVSQPRNVVGGHVVSALIGVACFKLSGGVPWVAGALAVSLSIAAMLATRTLHPPAGGTALTAVIGGAKIHALGFHYALLPCALGPAILVAVAVAANNLSPHRRYPEYWW